jgi:hypothetical protein
MDISETWSLDAMEGVGQVARLNEGSANHIEASFFAFTEW